MKVAHHLLLAVTTIALLLGTFFLFANWQTIYKRSTIPVTIAVSKTPLSAPIYIADEKGYFAESCADVKLTEVVGGNRSFQLMISGEADFATSSGSVVVFRGLVRQDFTNYASFVQSDNDVKFVTLEQSDVVSGLDFEGKRIGVTRGTASEYFLSTYLALAGLTLDDTKIVHLAPEQMSDALKQGEVDIIVPWEPFAHQAIDTFQGGAKLIPSKSFYTLSFNLLARKNNSAVTKESAECVLRALKKSIEFIAENPEASQKIVIDKLALDQKFINWVWQDYIFKLDLSDSLVMNLESQARWAIESKRVLSQQKIDFKSFLTPEPLKKVEPLAVNL